LAEKGTPDFYRQEAERLAGLAAEVASPALRLEMLQIAASFLKLAEYAAFHAAIPDLSKAKSA
jgi:hypothetical protein